MKKIIRRYIKRKLFPFAVHYGISEVNGYIDFITNSPIWQWRKRLWLVENTIGVYKVDKLEGLLRFLDE